MESGLLTRKKVSALTGFSAADIRRLVKKGVFPRPVRNGRGKELWSESAVVEFLKTRRKYPEVVE